MCERLRGSQDVYNVVGPHCKCGWLWQWITCFRSVMNVNVGNMTSLIWVTIHSSDWASVGKHLYDYRQQRLKCKWPSLLAAEVTKDCLNNDFQASNRGASHDNIKCCSFWMFGIAFHSLCLHNVLLSFQLSLFLCFGPVTLNDQKIMNICYNFFLYLLPCVSTVRHVK